MCSKYQEATKKQLSREIKQLRERCFDTCKRIENSLDVNTSHSNNVGQAALSYVEGVRTQIEKSDTPVSTDEYLIINQFLAELKINTEEVEKLKLFTRGAILDVENEIQRLNSCTQMVEEALSKPTIDRVDVQPEQLKNAREHFHILKNELHRILQSAFPNDNDLVVEITGQLIQERLNNESTGYIPITEENYRIIELLKDINVVSENPYNNMEVKLAY